FYRADLLGDPAHERDYRAKFGRALVPPQSWEDFADIAEFFHERDAGGSLSRAALPPLPERDDDLDRELYMVAAPCARGAVGDGDADPTPRVEIFSFHYDLESGAVRIDKPGFVHALKLLQLLGRLRPAEPTGEPAVKFLEGEAVLCLAAPS